MSRDTLRLLFSVLVSLQIIILIFIMTYSRNMSRKEVHENKVLTIAAEALLWSNVLYIVVPIIQIVLLYIVRV